MIRPTPISLAGSHTGVVLLSIAENRLRGLSFPSSFKRGASIAVSLASLTDGVLRASREVLMLEVS